MAQEALAKSDLKFKILHDYHARQLDISDDLTHDNVLEYGRKRDHESSDEYRIRQLDFLS